MLIVYTNDAGEAVRVEIDATLSETPTTSATLSEEPVDGIASISDHAIPDLEEVTFECVVTNTPLRVSSTHMDGVGGGERPLGNTGAVTLQFDTPFNRVRAVYEELRAMVRRGQVARFTTELRDYESFRIADLSVTVSTEDELNFSLTIRETIFASVEVVDAPVPRAPRERNARSRGAQQPEQAEVTGANRSVLDRLLVRR